MKRSDEEKLKASIVEALENWWDGGAQATEVPLPYVGDDTFEHMASAALAVMLALQDVEESMTRDGLLKQNIL